MNLLGTIFSFMNILELFICKNINKKIRKGILLLAKALTKFIDFSKYVFTHEQIKILENL